MFRCSIGEDAELRLLEERHAPELFALTDANRAHLRAWLPWVDATTSEQETRQFIRTALAQFAAADGFQAGIWYQGRLAGVIGYHSISTANRSTAIGYWLGAEFQGRGLMTRACAALVDFALSPEALGGLGLNRVEIRCAVENRKSRAIPERLGFQQEGVLRQAEWLYDHFVDHVVYGMLAEEWRALGGRLLPRVTGSSAQPSTRP